MVNPHGVYNVEAENGSRFRQNCAVFLRICIVSFLRIQRDRRVHHAIGAIQSIVKFVRIVQFANGLNFQCSYFEQTVYVACPVLTLQNVSLE